MGKECGMEELSKIMKALADINRIRILKMLEGNKLCVCELAYVLGITQPSVSRHLKKLKNAGIIKNEHEGFWTNYYINPDNGYSKALLGKLEQWANSDEIVLSDRAKIKKADRNKLCCQRTTPQAGKKRCQ
ncbi:MAG: metalloregulator ArsR/SmtB family transcription factor [Candidatus Omnitrophica bacterium]|nr:metalloregulator ArsR/SmtB family transcription factor [Candidatus Omnitrophota bacterium]MDD5487756.1 metalloregulator ArsR/SmtB family transcription factor [Candidatus Omnitrophota bacterium]